MRVASLLGAGVLLAVSVVAPVVLLRPPATGPVLRTVRVGFIPGMVAVDERTQHVFVTNSADQTVSMLDAYTGTVLRTIPINDEPDVITADARTNRIFVLTDPNNTVAVLDAVTGRLLHTLPVGRHPIALAVDEKSARLFVVNTNSGCVQHAPSLWDHLATVLHPVLRFLPRAARPVCLSRGSVTVIDTSRL